MKIKNLSYLLVLTFACHSVNAQIVQSPNKIVLPVPPATSMVFPIGQPVYYKSGTEVEINPEVQTPDGAEVIIETGTVVGAPADLNRNWLLSIKYDAQGSPWSASKIFYDNNGKLLQTQARNFTASKIMTSQVVYDFLGRPAVNTLAAPILANDFSYVDNFITSGGTPFRYDLFDNAVDDTTPGTLGWYYSNNNTLEPCVATTGYPFTRTEFRNDGTGEAKSTAGVGEAFKVGSGHDVRQYSIPALFELYHYFTIRNKYFTNAEIGEKPEKIINKAYQEIIRGADGDENIVIKDQSGNVLMTARPGNDMQVAVMAIVSTAPYYFKLYENTRINPAYVTFLDMDRGEVPVSPAADGTLPAGYYKAVGTGPNSGFSYILNLADVSYFYYNQLGQLIASIPPEGVKKLANEGYNNYATKTDIPFISFSEYDLKGQLRATSSKEAGRTEFVYRKDNNLRFAQNAEQRVTGRYSYTNFDGLGRVTESGEFEPAGGVAFNVNGMGIEENITDGGMGAGTRKSWKKTVYDIPVATGVAGYMQEDVYLPGMISYTETSDGAKSWQNFNEEGLVTWLVQEIPGLGKKTIDYSYDFNGKITKVIFQKNTPAETFVHYYEYNADMQLAAVYTNTADNRSTRKPLANYSYYLHGALKRKELGNKVQGIDYTYTVQGQLKAINNANRDQDPGQDGISGANAGVARDIFGMNIEYFSGDYLRANTNIGSLPIAAGDAEDHFNGLIKAAGWHSRKPQSILAVLGPGVENPVMYAYKYDTKQRLNNATWGTPNYAVPGFTQSSLFKEHGLSYDAHGNILSLKRTDNAGALTDNFTYQYPAGSNQLQAVLNGGTPFSSYQYNNIGQLKSESPASSPTRYVKYTAAGLVAGVYADAAFTQPKVTYTYDGKGARIMKKDFVNNTTTYYVVSISGNPLAVYSQSGTGTIAQIEIPLYADARVGIFRRGSNLADYEMTDHLGNVRAVIDDNRVVKQYADYYPFGSIARDGGTGDYRYGFQGQNSEKDKETGWNAFSLRMYDSRIGRWLTPDPAGQYASPYVGMGNNPVNKADKDGGLDEWVYANGDLYYDSRVNNQTDAAYYYGKDAVYMPNGSNYIDYTTGSQLSLRDNGVYWKNGQSYSSLDYGMMFGVSDAAFRSPVISQSNYFYGLGGIVFEPRAEAYVVKMAIEGWRWSSVSNANYQLTGRNANLFKNYPVSEAVQPVSKLARFVRGIGTASFVIATISDLYALGLHEGNPDAGITKEKFMLNFAFGLVGYLGKGYGAIPAALYFGMDTFYPGGWNGYAHDYEARQREISKSDPTFILAPSGAMKQ
ncbi:RHS repeat domain-containing protein [Chitinophaga flava]|nr:RHS repeat-associated core domain-containing protein [Chitinophaga flava]